MRSNHLQLGLALCSLFLVGACGSEERERCTLSAADEHGIRILECPGGKVGIPSGGSSTATCWRKEEEGGWSTIECDDGTLVRLDPDGVPHFPGKGTISGEITLWGMDEGHEGTVVRAIGTPFSTTTDAKGEFRMEGLPPGTYQLRAEARGRIPRIVKNVPVIRGEYSMDPLALRISETVSLDPHAAILPSPSKETLLVHEPSEGGRLTLIDLASWTKTRLSQNANSPSYRFDGRYVLWVENLTSRSRLMTFEIDKGVETELEPRGIAARYFSDGRAVLIHSVAEGKDGLLVLDLPSGEVVELGPWLPGDGGLETLPLAPAGGGVIFVRHTGETVFYNHLDRRQSVLSERSLTGGIHFSSTGKDLVFRRNRASFKELVHLDLRTDASAVLDEFLQDPTFDFGDGSLLWRKGSVWNLWDAASRKVVEVGEESLARWLPDGGGILLWNQGFSAGSTASLHDRETGVRTLLHKGAVGLPVASPDSRFVAIPVGPGEGPRTAVVSLDDKVEQILEGHGWEFLRDGRWLVRLIDGELFAADAKTGKQRKVRDGVKKLYPAGEDVVLFRSEADTGMEELWFWEAKKEHLGRIGPAADAAAVSSSGKYFFFFGCRDLSCTYLHRFDRKESKVEIVDDEVSIPWTLGDRYLSYVSTADSAGRALCLVPDLPD